MTVPSDFILEREEAIPEFVGTARLLRHPASGARILSVSAPDENKVFGVTFRTPPEDSTGLPHILEHSVLCGSRKYPVKEPFVELMKGSLQTFLNAFTFPDKTCYPVASTHLQDFYNLVDVYLDAVFFPRLTPRTLAQEGWHVEVESPDRPICYKGVVFNEMKGAYASPDNLLGEVVVQHLFPDTPYAHDSGGDPRQIPDLTWEAFQGFHQSRYQPGNAFFWFYGDDPPEARFDLIRPYLESFGPPDHEPALPLQSPFPGPREVEDGYAIDPDDPDPKTFVTLNWLWPETSDVDAALELGVLAHLLVGTPASLLRRALVESGLGEDLAGSGHGNYLRQMYFSTGLRGVEAGDEAKVEALILDTLAEIARSGFPQDLVEAALNTTEFHLREQNTGGFPRGLAWMLQALTAWLYDGDPIRALRFEPALDRLKASLAANPGLFVDRLRGHLLDNPHRVVVRLRPEPGRREREDAEERARLDALRASLSDADLERLAEETRELKAHQDRPDDPEALARIPRLGLGDLRRDAPEIPSEEIADGPVTWLLHDLPTPGVLYTDLALDLSHLDLTEAPWVSLLSTCMLEMGTRSQDYAAFTNRIGRDTGGIHVDLTTSVHHRTLEPVRHLMIRGKVLAHQIPLLPGIVRDLLLDLRLDQPDRLRQIVLEEKAGLEAELIPAGHSYVNQRLQAHFHPGHHFNEAAQGASYLLFLKGLAERLKKDPGGVVRDLTRVRERMVHKAWLVANLTGTADLLEAGREAWTELLHALPDGIPAAPAPEIAPILDRHEGLVISSKVNYVGRGLVLDRAAVPSEGAVMVANALVQTAWLWDQVRVKGGAYGSFARFEPDTGIMTFYSYRDPNLDATLDIYDRVPDFLAQARGISAAEFEKQQVGVIGRMDRHQLPDARGYTALVRRLTGITPDVIQRRRDEVFGAGPDDCATFGDAMRAALGGAHHVVMGARSALEASARLTQDGFAALKL